MYFKRQKTARKNHQRSFNSRDSSPLTYDGGNSDRDDKEVAPQMTAITEEDYDRNNGKYQEHEDSNYKSRHKPKPKSRSRSKDKSILKNEERHPFRSTQNHMSEQSRDKRAKKKKH